jgi:putative tricarboxylic transport membrane protein
VGWGYVFRQAGNPYHISTTSGSFITTPLFADTEWGPTSFTPVALLATDNVVLVVDRRSDIDSLEEFIEMATSKPPVIGGMGTIQVDYMVANLLARSAGFEFRYVPFNAQGELTTAVLSRSIDAMVGNPAAVLGLINSGDVRALAYSGAVTPAALGDVPTLRSKGFTDITISMPRGLILPPDVPLEVRDWWVEAIKEVVKKPEWQRYLAANLLTEDLRYGDDFHAYLVETNGAFTELLRELEQRN